MITALPTDAVAKATEQATRKTLDVGTAALAAFRELNSAGRSSSEAFTVYGYGLRVVKQAIQDETRILAELAAKPSAEIDPGCLDVAAVMTEHDVVEFKPVEIVKPK